MEMENFTLVAAFRRYQAAESAANRANNWRGKAPEYWRKAARRYAKLLVRAGYNPHAKLLSHARFETALWENANARACEWAWQWGL